VSDFGLAQYLRENVNGNQRLAERLEQAINRNDVKTGELQLVLAKTLTTSAAIAEALGEQLPLVVLSSKDSKAQLAGILTPFDLL
jgi:hypothetical protein